METDRVNNQKIDKMFLVEFNIFNSKHLPLFYAIMIQIDDSFDKLLTYNGKILLFKNIKSQKTNTFFKKNYNIDDFSSHFDVNNIYQFCDIPESIEYILENNSVDNAWLLDTINTLIDCIHTLGINLPDEMKKCIYLFADYLTFNIHYGDFFSENKVDRRYLADIVYLISGIIIHNIFVI